MIVEFNKEGVADIVINNENKYPLTINCLHILGKLEPIEDREMNIEPTVENIALLQFLSWNIETNLSDEIREAHPLPTIQIVEKYVEDHSQEEWDLIKGILAITEQNSMERKFLLAKHFLQELQSLLPTTL